MPHELHFDHERVIVDDIVEIDRADVAARLRVHRASDGSAVIVAASATTRDGAPLVGNLAVVPAGTGAILRSGRLRIALTWSATAVRRRAGTTGSRRCRVCFGAFMAEEIVVACGCDETFHDECDRARVDCPACGAPRTEVA
jgi:hypothetical protein